MNETIARAIAQSLDGNDGQFRATARINGTLIIATGSFHIEEYTENDYHNGTGACIVTAAEVSITHIEAYNEYGEEQDTCFDTTEIERCAEQILAA